MTEQIKQDWLGDQRLAALFGAVEAAGGQARIAGGAVRNGLWGLPVSDIDVATTLLPDAVMKAGKAAGFATHPTGIAHGTVTVVVDGLVVEVTTLRADVETDGRRAVVAFSDDWGKDAARRDFTFNALYCDLSGKVFDEIGQGVADCRARRVRFVGNAEQRIGEDYLRILRYFRFEAQYGNGSLDAASLAACRSLKGGLRQISAERKRVELLKTLSGKRAAAVVELMMQSGVLQLIIEVTGTVEGLARLIDVEARAGVEPDGLRRLAMLTEKADHLRLSNQDLKRFHNMTRRTPLTPGLDELEQKQMLYKLGVANYRDQVLLNWASLLTQVKEADWLGLYRLADDWPVPVFPVKGKDLVAAGFAPGKSLGDLLCDLESLWINRGFEMDRAALLAEAETGKK
jgi:poly(A) polymerase